MPGTPWSNTELKLLKQLLNDGDSIDEISLKFTHLNKVSREVNKRTIKSIFWKAKRKKWIPGGTRKKWTETKIQFLKDNYQTMSYSAIGKIIGRSEKSVWYKAYSMGLKKNNKTQWTYEMDLKLYNLRRETNLSCGEIGEMLGVSKYAVRNRMSREGLALHPPKMPEDYRERLMNAEIQREKVIP